MSKDFTLTIKVKFDSKENADAQSIDLFDMIDEAISHQASKCGATANVVKVEEDEWLSDI